MAAVMERQKPKLDLKWLKRMEKNLREAKDSVDEMARTHPVIEAEFDTLRNLLGEMHSEFDAAFVAVDPECRPNA